ncbi:MAG: hypothetical protein FJ088_02340 [Deltaproteobacteria bacterium]|nr:hypothetical protein [Deltaproteobacteria bacterium]
MLKTRIVPLKRNPSYRVFNIDQPMIEGVDLNHEDSEFMWTYALRISDLGSVADFISRSVNSNELLEAILEKIEDDASSGRRVYERLVDLSKSGISQSEALVNYLAPMLGAPKWLDLFWSYISRNMGEEFLTDFIKPEMFVFSRLIARLKERNAPPGKYLIIQKNFSGYVNGGHDFPEYKIVSDRLIYTDRSKNSVEYDNMNLCPWARSYMVLDVRYL